MVLSSFFSGTGELYEIQNIIEDQMQDKCNSGENLPTEIIIYPAFSDTYVSKGKMSAVNGRVDINWE